MAKGKLYIQYFNKKDGTPKTEDELRAKQMESFSVRDGDPLFFMDYEFPNGLTYRFVFLHDNISITRIFPGKPNERYALTDYDGFFRLGDDSDEENI